MQTELYFFSCTGLSFESWDFGGHFSAPEMLGFEHTFSLTETLSFGLQFWRVCFAIRLCISTTFQLVQNPILFL
jgi:hypothetical protein